MKNRPVVVKGLCGLIGSVLVLAQAAFAQEVRGKDSPATQAALRMNAHFIGAPAPGQDRNAWLEALKAHREQTRSKLDLGIYDRPDLEWVRAAFTCHFTFMYDRSFYNPATNEYTVDSFLKDGRETFGGYDALVLWQGYPRLGVDARNQFDMYRDMPGGLTGLREGVERLHRQGVKVFIDYNPWDTGTRRENRSDDEALAELVTALDADGIFLDTMAVAPSGLRRTIDRAGPGVAFVPEVHPEQDQLSLCSGSWAQWLDDRNPPGLLHLKWIEPAHMQYQIRRWDLRHTAEISAAFFNGSGIMIWENVFGAFNAWAPEDQLLWRRASRILHRFAGHFASDRWDPFYPTASDRLFAHRWPGRGATLFTFRSMPAPQRQSSEADPPFIEVEPDEGPLFVDLWHGRMLSARPAGARLRVEVPLGDGLGCVAVLPGADVPADLRDLLERQRSDGIQQAGAERGLLKPTVYSESITRTPLAERPPAGMVSVPGGSFRMEITHQRRECGCYLDPDAKAQIGKDFQWGDPHGQQIRHVISVNVRAFHIDEAEVSNTAFKRFLDATGYRPKHDANFLAHWENGAIPAHLEDHPVVYVDLDDARAYARWAGKRLPTEAEWQLAAQGPDGRKWPWGTEFDAARCNTTGEKTLPVRSLPQGRSPSGCYHMSGNVWEWTDGEYDDGRTRFSMIRGGSYFDAKTSGWYIRGGPQPCDHHVKFIRMWPGLDRCATVGFRCVVDAGE